uniref:uncharacterized protein LOC120347084 n=1 Tax=Styela clava TaxID=7725 RepID=UPI00193A5640|nr:uncharacterized protein LOC120347084 [Styela clava]
MEWQNLRHDLHILQIPAMENVCKYLAAAPEYPCFQVLGKVLQVFAAGTSGAERGFSSINIIKTKHRNRLSSRHLTMLVRCGEETSIKADKAESFFKDVLQHWKDSKLRRHEQAAEATPSVFIRSLLYFYL